MITKRSEFLNGIKAELPILLGVVPFGLIYGVSSRGAGIPPLAGFFGKFLLFKAAIAEGAAHPAYYWLVAIAIFGVVVSLYYYFGIIRAIFWSQSGPDLSPISISRPLRFSLYACLAGMFLLGVYPNPVVNLATAAVLRSAPRQAQAGISKFF